MKILDMCCGSKMFWYEKHEPHTTYMDIRKATYTAKDRGKVRKLKLIQIFKPIGKTFHLMMLRLI